MTPSRKDGVLIAETTETGEIDWLWLLPVGQAVPRPLRPGAVRPIRLDRFEVCRAPVEAVRRWLGLARRR